MSGTFQDAPTSVLMLVKRCSPMRWCAFFIIASRRFFAPASGAISIKVCSSSHSYQTSSGHPGHRPGDLRTQMGAQAVEFFCRGELELLIVAPGAHVDGAACRRFRTKCGRATTRGARGISTRRAGRRRSSTTGYGVTASPPAALIARN